MIDSILNNEVQEFIKNNEQKAIDTLLLSAQFPDACSKQLIAQQISGKQKIRKKLPTWFSTERILYPPSLSLEQCSSEQTADFKASLFKGDRCADLTGGFGVDTFALSKRFNSVAYFELNKDLAAIVTHNFTQLNAQNITVHNCSGIEALNTTNSPLDLLYIDPARRDANNKKMHSFKDCTPDVLALQTQLLATANTVLIKASPMLDLKRCLQELRSVSSIYVVSLNNECKELLFVMDRKADSPPTINCILLGKQTRLFSFTFEQEQEAALSINAPGNFIYIADAAILKAGAFKSLAAHYKLDKLHQHSHVYTSNFLVENFPGKTYRLVTIHSATTKQIKKSFAGKKVSIISKNFYSKPETLHQKWKLQKGEDAILLATTLKGDQKAVLEIERLKEAQ